MILQKCFVFQDKPLVQSKQESINPSLELAFAISDFFGKRIEEIFIYERGAENEKE